MSVPEDHVVRRLKHRLDDARRLGFRVRMEVLDDEQPGWCQIGNTRLLFVNLSQTAAEQLAEVDETLAEFLSAARPGNAAERSTDPLKAA